MFLPAAKWTGEVFQFYKVRLKQADEREHGGNDLISILQSPIKAECLRGQPYRKEISILQSPIKALPTHRWKHRTSISILQSPIKAHIVRCFKAGFWISILQSPIKAKGVGLQFARLVRFQFYKVRLKHSYWRRVIISSFVFQFYKVRLKQFCFDSLPLNRGDFNSTKSD